ncbi:MAG: hypothetical protein EOP47_13695 [Sphingobacteriaceae bacterium]|nr:MAG: hypothetical protein EOP47_13695 [Sphingobacteriaceae bacterium]
MKKIFILLFITLTSVMFQACDKNSLGDAYENVPNPLPPYVALTSTAGIETSAGETFDVTFVVRTALQQKVTITYGVTGALTLANQTIELPRNALTVKATIAVPEGTADGDAVLTLIKATKADGGAMTIGPKNNAATQKVNITIAAPEEEPAT